ncbi:MAG: hypothetical protein ABIH23_14500 [bacterium]
MNIVGKWCIAIAFVVAMAGTVMAAAPTANVYVKSLNTYTVDAQVSGTWDNLDTAVVVASDTAALYISIQGTAIMDPGNKLYIGFSCHQALRATAVAPNIDTFTVTCPPGAKGKQHIPFYFEYLTCDTVSTSTTATSTFRGSLGDPFLGYIGGVTDTVAFKAACGGSTTREYVYLENVTLTVKILDQAVCYDRTYKR